MDKKAFLELLADPARQDIADQAIKILVDTDHTFHDLDIVDGKIEVFPPKRQQQFFWWNIWKAVRDIKLFIL